MLDNIKIGVVGIGYVGKACIEFFNQYYTVYSYDINSSGTEKSLHNLVLKADIIFICVPSPMKKDGSCDTSIVENVLQEINNHNEALVVIKSTLTPGTSKKLSKKFQKLKIFFNPEFLTEANFIEDFKNQNRIIIGGDRCNLLKNLYTDSFPNAEIVECKLEEAEMVKYFTNAFLATKVSFANEFYSLCTKMDINYETVVDIAMLDNRLGKSHFSVPGPDGNFGFGGSCFPKDLMAIMTLFKTNNIKPYVLNSVWERNIKEDRKAQDWKKLIGRAVSE